MRSTRCIGFGILVFLTRSALSHPRVQLPHVSLDEIESSSPHAVATVFHALSELGAVVVTNVWRSEHSGKESLPHAEALEAWATCLFSGGDAHPQAVARLVAGGYIRRVSVGSNFRLDDKGQSLNVTDCESASHRHTEMHRGVKEAAVALGAVLDAHALAAENAVGGFTEPRSYEPERNTDLVRLVDVLERAEHLEHVHVYEEIHQMRHVDVESKEVLSLHTDAGLLLAFVPPASSEPGESHLAEIALSNGEMAELASIPERSVVFFVGEAAQFLHAVNPALTLRPLPHKLALPSGFGWRAWYGMMFLLPDTALVRANSSSDWVTFGDVWAGARASLIDAEDDPRMDFAPIACGGRLLADEVAACPAGKVECWMTCMVVTPELQDCSATKMWIPSGKGDIVDQVQLTVGCREPDTGKSWPAETGEMCPSCRLACTSGESQAQHPGKQNKTTAGGFCVPLTGGTGASMYMEGFVWTSLSPDESCLCFLSNAWVLDTKWKFWLACAIVVVFCSLVEPLAVVRHWLPRSREWDLGLLMFGLNLMASYLAMLFVMMYSLEIFLAVVLGLVIGHVLAVRTRKKPGQVASARNNNSFLTPCCRVDPSDMPPDAAGSGAAPVMAASGHVLETPLLEKQHVALDVEGMTCKSCEGTVTKALFAVQGVVAVVINLEQGKVGVTFVSPVTATALCDELASIGFPASLEQ